MKIVLMALMVWASQALATDEVFKRGPFEVRVTPFPSTFLSPEMAQQYGLARSETQAILNYRSMTRGSNRALKRSGPTQRPASQPAGQAFELEFQTIDEGEAIYYIAPSESRTKTPCALPLKCCPKASECRWT